MSNKFIKDVLLPYFHGYDDTGIDIALFDLDGGLLYTTPKVSTKLTIPLHELIGKSYKSTTQEIISQACDVFEDNDIEKILQVTQKIAQIHEVVITKKIVINYIDFLPYKNYYAAHLVNYFPLFDLTGKVIATQLISNEFCLFGILDYLNELVGKRQQLVLKNISLDPNVKLSSRQHEVLFLLLCGMSQHDIGLFLNLKHGSVSSFISRMCTQFDISGINVDQLLKKARKLKYGVKQGG